MQSIPEQKEELSYITEILNKVTIATGERAKETSLEVKHLTKGMFLYAIYPV